MCNSANGRRAWNTIQKQKQYRERYSPSTLQVVERPAQSAITSALDLCFRLHIVCTSCVIRSVLACANVSAAHRQLVIIPAAAIAAASACTVSDVFVAAVGLRQPPCSLLVAVC
jgi:hypothetical protein